MKKKDEIENEFLKLNNACWIEYAMKFNQNKTYDCYYWKVNFPWCDGTVTIWSEIEDTALIAKVFYCLKSESKIKFI